MATLEEVLVRFFDRESPNTSPYLSCVVSSRALKAGVGVFKDEDEPKPTPTQPKERESAGANAAARGATDRNDLISERAKRKEGRDERDRSEGQEAAAEEEEEEETRLDLVEDSQLGKAISRQLKEVYIPLETWYLRSAIERVSRGSVL